MRIPLFQVDAFTNRRFAGKPATVMVMDGFPDDAVLHAIAAENNLSETAFLAPAGVDYRLRWFTPLVEVSPCSHAALASAAVVMERLQRERREVLFHTANGPLTVKRTLSGYVLDLPVRATMPCPVQPSLSEALGVIPLEVIVDAANYTAVLADARVVRELAPNLAAIERLDRSGVAVTAPGDHHYDFVSRYFAPAKGMPEDPVNGGVHCALAPYWAKRLNRTVFRAYQASPRGGEVICRLAGNRVELEGSCVFYLEGHVDI
jgi:PhzF family phenazine biosynthesis protein